MLTFGFSATGGKKEKNYFEAVYIYMTNVGALNFTRNISAGKPSTCTSWTIVH